MTWKKNSNICPCEREELITLIQKYKELFLDVPRSTNVLTHDVEVTDTRPVKQHPYRLNSRKLKALKRRSGVYARKLDDRTQSKLVGLTLRFGG